MQADRLAPAVPRSRVPSLLRSRRWRRLILGSLVVSAAATAGIVYLAQRAREKPFEDAAERRAKIGEARRIAKLYALEGFPAWVVTNPDYPCPQRLSELNELVDRTDTTDPWGLPYQSFCHNGHSFRVVSAGPDRTHGTYDDIIEGT